MKLNPYPMSRRIGRALLLPQGIVAFVLIALTQAGCMGYLAAAIAGPGKWEVDRIDVSRISEIVVGETTREQIEAMFGVPNFTHRYSTDKHLKDYVADMYIYQISRMSYKGDIVWGLGGKSDNKRLLAVNFKADVVTLFMGPEPGAVELLEKLSK
jgi:outer membrane protein assembly factor BamE (lipoprotein component of BamABCDE complex)